MADSYRVMVVDDSAVIRGLLTRTLESDPEISVIASVPNGKQAISALDQHDVEIIVLDIEMPVMDGMTALPLLLEKKPNVNVLMASTLTTNNAAISLRALAMGAADYVAKPTSTREIHSANTFKREITEKVKAIAEAARNEYDRAPVLATHRSATPQSVAGVTRVRAKVLAETALRQAPVTTPELIAIGSSTGGPQALFQLLGDLANHVQLPIMITQHMPASFTALLAGHISRVSPVPCEEGRDGEVIVPGRIYLAPGDYHMVAEPGQDGNIIRLIQTEPENFCRPAVDPMLRSLAKIYGSRLLVIILTGMGTDGSKGSRAVVTTGGSVIAQDEESSVVWGMPGAVAAAGLCSAVLPLTDIASYVRKLVVRTAA